LRNADLMRVTIVRVAIGVVVDVLFQPLDYWIA